MGVALPKQATGFELAKFATAKEVATSCPVINENSTVRLNPAKLQKEPQNACSGK
jgi:hypothetical protein